ncbi:Actin-like protein arp9 [Diatrype stigma]|uniref:Actin-like protein arp9 n=1 Tax=Diatrype stigma TaxID=117547 RepID=A0AAN9UGR0_9PEZI
MGRAKETKRRSAAQASTPATEASVPNGSPSSQSGRPSKPAPAPAPAPGQAQEAAPPSAKLGNLRLVESDDKRPGDPQPARQAKAKPAANHAWGRVGPRELGAILQPSFLDRPRLPSLSHSFEVEEEADDDDDDVALPRTPSAHDGNSSSDNGQTFAVFNPNTPSSNGKRLPKGYAVGHAVASIPSRTLGRQRQRRGKSNTPVPLGHRNHYLHQFHNTSTPRGQRARNRELTRGLGVGGEENGHHPANGNGNGNDTMASQQSKWREEMVLVICPGSQTTMAQLGCNELTPPTHRFPTRMFKDPSGAGSGYRPYHTYRRKKATAAINGAAVAAANGTAAFNEDDYEDVEDPDNVEGAIYPLQGEFGAMRCDA